MGSNTRTMTLNEVAGELGIGLTLCRKLAREDSLPVPVIRIGRRMVVSRAAVEALLAPHVKSDDSEPRPNEAWND